MREFATPSFPIYMYDKDGNYSVTTMGEVFPPLPCESCRLLISPHTLDDFALFSIGCVFCFFFLFSHEANVFDRFFRILLVQMILRVVARRRMSLRVVFFSFSSQC